MRYTNYEWEKLPATERNRLMFSNKAPKNVQYGFPIFLGVIILVVVLLIRSCNSNAEEAKNRVPTHKEIIEAQFSPWDGSHRNLEKVIKANLKDPASYEHVSTMYWDEQDSIIIKTTVRAKNSFGAVVPATYRAVADLKGNLRNITQEN